MGAPKLDPHLREVLEDLVRTGPADGYFAKLQPEQIGGVFRAPDEPVSIARAGFSSLERHLVRFHREELALVLRKSFLTSFFAVHPKPAGDFHLDPPRTLAARAEEAANHVCPEAYTYRSSHFLRRILQGEPITNPAEQISMLVASMRLEDHAHARHYYAMCLLRDEQFESVKQCIRPLISHSAPESTVAAYGLWRETLVAAGNMQAAQETCTKTIHLARKWDIDTIGSTETVALHMLAALDGNDGALDRAAHFATPNADELSAFGSLLEENLRLGHIQPENARRASRWIQEKCR